MHKRQAILYRGSTKPEMLAYIIIMVSSSDKVAFNPSQVIQRSNLNATVFLISIVSLSQGISIN